MPFTQLKKFNIRQAVIATLAYFEIFNLALSREEIYDYFFFLPVDKRKINLYLNESQLLEERDDYFFLKKGRRNPEEFWQRFLEQKKRTKEYWQFIKKFRFLFNLCPFIKLVAVCNSVPLQAVTPNSDIDLLIITKKNRLFLARLAISLLTSVFLIRRHHNKIKKKFCLSFYLSEDNLNLSKIAQKPFDIYLAYWVKSLEPIAGDYQVYQKFLQTNQSWLKSYFKYSSWRRRYFKKASIWQKFLKKNLEKLLDKEAWESSCREWQLKRAYQKYKKLKDKSGTVINDKILKFHDYDIRQEVREKWLARLKDFKIEI